MQNLNPFKSKYVLWWLFWDTRWYFYFFYYFLWAFYRVFLMILLWFTLAECHSMLAASLFYSVILRFRGTTDSPPLLPWVPEPMLCQPFWWLVLSLFLIIFFFFFSFGVVSLKASYWLPLWVVLRGLTSNISSLKASKPYHFRLSFLVVFLLVIFPRWAESILAKLKVFLTTSLYSFSF